MKKTSLMVVFALLGFLTFAQPADQVIPGRFRVKLTTEAVKRLEGVTLNSKSGGPLQLGMPSFDRALSKHSATEMKRVFRYSPKYEADHRAYGLHLWYEITVPASENPMNAVNDFKTLVEVTHAEPVLKASVNSYAGPKGRRAKALPVNDPSLNLQWHYGSSESIPGGVPDADINLYEAWKVTKGSKDVVVAIVDGGVDFRHEDLRDNMWVNTAELNGTAGVDDDNNGYVDDIYGYNFVTNSGTINPASHGTHVAGTVGAVNNNGIGVSGVAGGSGMRDGVRLMSCQVFLESGSVGNFGEALIYAADNGAVISQNSWGYNTPGFFEQATLDAIDYFNNTAGRGEFGEKMSGGLCIFAAGNNASEEMHWPGCYDSVIAVTALNHSKHLASYANFGTWVELSAPGGEEVPTAGGVYSTLPENAYGYMPGTSMACPHVSGIAALVLTKYGSRAFTPAMLTNRLFSACVNVDEFSPSYGGKIGIGLIDAAKALQEDNKIAPHKITDLTQASAMQNSVTVSFTAPGDADNQKATSYIFYYSRQMLTPENYTKAQIFSAPASDSGVTEKITIPGLAVNTNYYVAIIAVDIWGNNSELSNVLEMTTSNHPTPEVSIAAPLNIVWNVNSDTVTWKEFTVKNVGEGRFDFSTMMSTTTDPRPRMADPYFLDKIQIDSDKDSPGFIGEDGKSGEFWAGMQFAAGEKAFNLTHLEMSFVESQELDEVTIQPTDSMTIKVYRGGNRPGDGKCVLSTKYLRNKNTWMSPEMSFIDLKDQVYFEPGEKFWVVVEFPAKWKHPISIDQALPATVLGKSLYSVDSGAVWTDINTLGLAYDSHWAYKLRALSKIGRLPEYAKFVPTSGEVVNDGQGMKVKVGFFGNDIPNGKYTGKVKLVNSTPHQGPLVVPVNLDVRGHVGKARLSSKILDFPATILGNSSSLELTLFNDGLGSISVSEVICNNPQFVAKIDTNVVIAQTKVALKVKFTPTATGVVMGKMTLKTNIGEIVVSMGASGLPAPEIGIEPAVLTTNLADGEQKDVNFTVKNSGNYTLSYSFPDFVKNPKQKSAATLETPGGYKIYKSNDANSGVTHQWTDMSDAEDITKQVEMMDPEGRKLLHTIDLGFSFEYYGVRYDQIRVARQGYIILGGTPGQVDQFYNYNGFGISDNPGKSMAAFMIGDYAPSKSDAKVLVHREPGMIVIEFQKVGPQFTAVRPSIDAQMVLHYDGTFEFRYQNMKNLGNYGFEQMMSVAWTGFESADIKDFYSFRPLRYYLDPNDNWNTVYYYDEALIAKDVNAKVTWKMTPANPKFVQKVEPTEGVLQPGESLQHKATIFAEKMIDNRYAGAITVESNDPTKLVSSYPLDVTFTSFSKFEHDSDTIRFENVPSSFEKEHIFTYRNQGGRKLALDTVYSDSEHFKVLSFSKECLPYSGGKAYVRFAPTAEGSFRGNLYVKTADSTARIPILATSYDPPIAHNLGTDMTFELAKGAHVDTALTFRNDGAKNLNMVFGHPHWIQMLNNPTAGPKAATDKSGYYYITSDEDPSVTYEWYTPSDSAKWLPIDPPRPNGFELSISDNPFTFYGKKYSSIFISFFGFVAFDKMDDVNFSNSDRIPFAGGINNYIAPSRQALFAGNTGDNIDGRVFYERHSDKHVITWNKVVRMLHNIYENMSFQLVLFDDGRIKFQYKDVEQAFWASDGVIGIENVGGTDGLEIAHLTRMFHNRMAIDIIPASTYTLEPNESVRVPFRVNAAELFAGDFVAPIRVGTNDPHPDRNPLKVNVTVKVAGNENFEYTQAISFDTVLGYCTKYETVGGEKVCRERNTYSRDFSFTNTGDKPIVFNDFQAGEYQDEFKVDGLPEARPITLYPGRSFKAKVHFTPLKTGVYDFKMQWVVRTDSVIDCPDEGMPSGDLCYHHTWDTLCATSIKAYSMIPAQAAFKNDSIYQSFVTKPALGTTADTFFVLTNKGEDSLRYKLRIDFIAGVEPASVQSATQAPKMRSSSVSPAMRAMASINGIPTLQPKNVPVFIDSLLLPNGILRTLYTSTTKDYSLWAAHRFKAKSSGFNLSHVKLYYWSTEEGPTTKIIIRSGESVDNAKEIYSQEITTKNDMPKNPDGNMGEWGIFQLNKRIYFQPGEYFWVLITSNGENFAYGLGVHDTPEYDADDHKAVFDGNRSVDLSSATQGSYPNPAWAIQVFSDTAYSSEPWITLDKTIGVLGNGDFDTIRVTVNPDRVLENFKYVSANVKLESNDPQPVGLTFHVRMNLNSSPGFTLTPTSVSVKEGDTARINFLVKDDEGDAFTVALVENYPNTSLVKKTDSTYQFVMTTDYNSAGLHSFVIAATQEDGKVTKRSFVVNVVNVNRYARFKGGDTIMIARDADVAVVNMNKYFEDPDGDVLTYRVDNSGNFVSISSVREKLYLMPIKIGSENIYIKATEHDSTVEGSLLVVVYDEVGNQDNLDANFMQLYPNPVQKDLFCKFRLDAPASLRFEVSNGLGQKIFESTFQSFDSGDGQFVIDAQSWKAGYYVVVLYRDGKAYARSIVMKP